MYGALGERGVYTRRKGLDHETHKELLLKHLREGARDGSPLSELVQVLPHLGERKVQSLLAELRSERRVRIAGNAAGPDGFRSDLCTIIASRVVDSKADS